MKLKQRPYDFQVEELTDRTPGASTATESCKLPSATARPFELQLGDARLPLTPSAPMISSERPDCTIPSDSGGGPQPACCRMNAIAPPVGDQAGKRSCHA